MRKLLYISIFVLGFVLNFNTASSDTKPTEYQALSPIPGLTDTKVSFDTSGTNPTSGSGLSDRISGLYKWGVALTSGLAVLVIMWGGVGYMTSAGGSGIEEAKGRISAALMGLMLALGSYIILKTINQDLLETTFELEPLTAVSTTNTSGTTAGTIAGSYVSTGVAGATLGTTGSVTAGSTSLITNADGTQQITINTPGLDTDGYNPPPFNDPDWSSSTSYGNLDSNKDVYVAVPNSSIPLGTSVTITNHTTGMSVNGIVGDHQGTSEQINSVAGKTAYGEISIAAANALGMNVTGNSLPNHSLTIKYNTSK